MKGFYLFAYLGVVFLLAAGPAVLPWYLISANRRIHSWARFILTNVLVALVMAALIFWAYTYEPDDQFGLALVFLANGIPFAANVMFFFILQYKKEP